MTFSIQCKKPQLPSLIISKANFFLVTRYLSRFEIDKQQLCALVGPLDFRLSRKNMSCIAFIRNSFGYSSITKLFLRKKIAFEQQPLQIGSVFLSSLSIVESDLMQLSDLKCASVANLIGTNDHIYSVLCVLYVF